MLFRSRIGQDDTTKIADILSELANTPIGLDGTGYGASDLDALIDEIAGMGEPEPEYEDKEFSNQYGVIVTCETEEEQEKTYNKLLAQGYTVKVVVV